MQKKITNILVKYSAEIGNKSEGVRKKFSNILRQNISNAFPGSNVKAKWDYLILYHPDARGINLGQFPGISNYAPYTLENFNDFDDLLVKAFQFFKPMIEGKSFAVRCKRKGIHSFRSPEVERELGALLGVLSKVDLSRPDVTCYLEIRHDDVYLFSEKHEGIGGLPVRSQGKGLMLISGGIDSAVAAAMTYKTGVALDYLFIDLGGQEQIDCAKATAEKTIHTRGAGVTSKIFYINFIPVIAEIRKVDESYQNLALKYCFYKVAEMVARDTGAEAIFTGESIGQVSTQTFPNLVALDQVCSIPVFRPLLCLTKQEIISEAVKLGTFEISYKGKENCALSEKKVETRAIYDKLISKIAVIDISVLEKAVNEKLQLKDIGHETFKDAKTKAGEDIFAGRKLIDLRSENEFSRNPLEGAENIPFDTAWNEFQDWDSEKKYLLVCDSGERSALLHQYMQESGFDVKYIKESGKLLRKK